MIYDADYIPEVLPAENACFGSVDSLLLLTDKKGPQFPICDLVTILLLASHLAKVFT
jgi:hypothetical protein